MNTSYSPLNYWRVTAEDVYSFIRCPRILAFKVSGVRLDKWSHKPSRTPSLPATVIGRIGEEALAQALRLRGAVESSFEAFKAGREGKGFPVEASKESEEYSEDISLVAKKKIVKKVELFVNDELIGKAREYLNDIVDSAFHGAKAVVEYLESRYGKPVVYARARVTSTLLQSSGEPDFIVGFKGGKYVIVEVKNTKQLDREHQIKVGFYIEASKLAGASILLERNYEWSRACTYRY